MAVTERLINANPERIFQVLADGWSYSDWVVGTAHIRDVDEHWPAPGAEIQHKAGPWPVSLRDTTTSLQCEPNRMLHLKVRLWPLGAGHVTFELTPVGPDRTRLRMREDFTEGPLRWLRTKINDLALHYRNRESIRRLADIAVRRARQDADHPR